MPELFEQYEQELQKRMKEDEKTKVVGTFSVKDDNIISRFKDRLFFPDRTKDKGIINEDTGSIILTNGDGSITLATNNDNVINMGKDNVSIVSKTNVINTNRSIINTDDIIINNHKFNNQLYELSDFCNIGTDKEVGNLNISGSVLVKAWEPILQRFVLIRRPYYGPMFHKTLNMNNVDERLNVDIDIRTELEKLERR